MNIIQLGHISINSPRTWNECSKDQLYYIASQLQKWRPVFSSSKAYLKKEQSKAVLFIRMALLQVMLGVNPFNVFSSRTRAFRKILPEQMLDLLKTVDFIFESNNLTENKFPIINGLHGPADGLRFLSVGEFAFTETYFLKYHTTQSEEFLNKLCATLYREQAFENQDHLDKRAKFNDASIDSRAQKIKGWNSHLKQVVLLFYIGCREKIIRDNQSLFTKTKKGDKQKQNWAELILDLSGDKFGSMDQTSDTPIFTILVYLKKLQKQADKK